MEVTIWIERSLGLNVAKQLPHGSTLRDLKAALLTDDLFGSLSAEDLLLVAPAAPWSVLGDGEVITEGLLELEIKPPGEEQAGEAVLDAPAWDAQADAGTAPAADAEAWMPHPDAADHGLAPSYEGEAWGQAAAPYAEVSPAQAGAWPAEGAVEASWQEDVAAGAADWPVEGGAEASWQEDPAAGPPPYAADGAAEVPDAPEGTVHYPPAEGPVPLSVLPKALGGELKWFVWNAMWHAINLHVASHGHFSVREERLNKASGDGERTEKHFEAAKELAIVSPQALLQLRAQAEAGGAAAAAQYLDGAPLRPDTVQSLPPPDELGAGLWEQMVVAVRHAAVAGNEMNLSDMFKDKPQVQYMHWMKGAESQQYFERHWHGLYDSPPTPPPERAPEQPASPQNAVETDPGPLEAAGKQAEIERRALESREAVKRTANGAQKLLGPPLAYKVVRDCPVYAEPMPQAKKTTRVTAGMRVLGYPGSAAWIKIDARASGLPKEAMLVPQAWMPVRDHEAPERELVLHALWHELRAEKTLPESIEVSWKGVDQPVEPNVAEYTVEVRAKDDQLGKIDTVVSGTTKTRAAVKGLIPNADVQVRVKLRIVGPYSVDFRLSGPWADFRTAEESASPPEEAAPAEPADGAAKRVDVEGEGIYEVMHTFVTLRGEPSTKGTIKGTLKKGAVVYGMPFPVGKEPWIKLTPQTIPAAVAHMPPRDISDGESVFVLIDATTIPSLKLGVLLKRVGEGGADDSRKKLGEWKVIHDKVMVRAKAAVDAPALGYHKKGSKVLGVCLPVGGVDWLRVQNPNLQGVQSPDAWMLIDGKSVGLGKLLERLRDAPQDADKRKGKTLPKSSTRPPPPRPLTVPWLAAHGGMPSPPTAAKEEELDVDLDVGMASQCSMLRVQPADGGAGLSYIAKRGPEWGDMASCGREFRFYTEIATRGWKPGSTDPCKLGGEMQVPRCMCANWGKEGKEREGFILILELLDEPEWVPVDAEIGCTYEQAVAAIETLGQMHRVFDDKMLSGHEFDWLPATVFDVRNAGHIQGYFTSILGSAQPLVQLLPPGAQATVERMAEGGLGESFERLAQHPLCLCHGDYRTENLRFSAPGRPPAVAVFDWGLVNVARGIADFAYFVMLSLKPDERRKHERDLLARYLEARGDGAKKLDEAYEDLKSASIAILGMILMTRHGVKTGFKDGTRNMLVRMMRWVGEAITDWRSIEAIPTSYW